MNELYFTDTVRCMLGTNSNCVMNGKLRFGPNCAKCGFNLNVHKRRVNRLREEGLKTFSNGKAGLVL